MYDSVQFRGKEAIMQAYRLREVDVWGIWQKNTLNMKGDDEEGLSQYLDMLIASGGNAIYTLKIFEDIDDPKMVKEKTQADGSFNFRLGSVDDTSMMPELYARTNAKNKLFERLDAIEAKLAGAEPQEDIHDRIIGIISDPNQLMQYAEVFKFLFSNNNQPQPQLPPRMAAVGNVVPMDKQPRKPPTEKEMERLSVALDTLGDNDPKLIEHLEKLAKISATNKSLFTTLTNMLEGMS